MEKSSFVTCPICGKQLTSLSSKHLKTHTTSVKELRITHPNVIIYSDVFLERKKILDDNYRKNNKEKLDKYFENYRVENSYKRNEYQKQYRKDNLEKVREKDKAYVLLNKEEKKKYDKEYRKLNNEKIKRYQQEYRKKYPYRKLWLDILYSTLKRLGRDKEGHTIDLLGYSAIDLKEHIEKQFTDGMSWDNHGEWHIDHKKPISSFDEGTPMNIVNDLINLQPLWASDKEINGVKYKGNLNKNKYYEK